jgi:ABC-type transport system substrate-binding protein
MLPSRSLNNLVAGAVAVAILVGGIDSRSVWAAVSASIDLNYFGATERIRGFDPVTSNDTTSSRAVSTVYEGLYEYEYLVRPYTVRPLLAEGMPEVSPDGLTYTIRIKKGVKFADDPCFPGGKGRELIAEDFVYSWKRVADTRNMSTCYWIFEDHIVGLDGFHERSTKDQANYGERIEGLQALDRYTLQLKLARPYPQLIWVLTMSYTFAVPHEAVAYYGKEFLNHPVGTGPYIIKDWKWRNHGIVYVKNPTYHGDTYPTRGEPGDKEKGLLDDAGKPAPILKEITLNVIADQSTEWLVFLSGAIAYPIFGISHDNFEAVITSQEELAPELKARGIRLVKTPELYTFYLGFNMDDPVVGASSDPDVSLRHKKLRHALSHTIDIDKWDEFYNHRMVPANGPIPPNMSGYDATKPLPYPFDLKKARQLIAEAGYPDGRDPKTGDRLAVTMELPNASDPGERQSLDLIGSFFDQIGVQLKPSYNNWPEFLKKMERRQCQMYRLAWVADYPDAENFLQLFYSKSASPGPNNSNYSNPEFDRLFEQAHTMLDSPERTALYQKMAAIVVEDAPWITLSYPLAFGLYQPWFKNYKPHDFPYPFLKFYSVDPALMKR